MKWILLLSVVQLCFGPNQNVVGKRRNAGSKRRKRIDMEVKARTVFCEREDCAHIIPEEAMNCINKCVSEQCFTEIYAAIPLEDGEIDLRRAREFDKCAKYEEKEQRAAARRKQKDE
uniref:Uncharacterized protein n=1 Tax=Grammatophora oceanica TaxID=210454 RepID=A0A7S1VMC4_9STRA|mmetsp:Transcript_50363/g.75282  ORF Transcript_50363/g.75282 Transcript_50363/m.75282 type:complete len:117 (+) Transcript_50363:49-399(+)